MTEYFVRWEIDITADTPEEAARHVQSIMRDPHNIASYFTVTDKANGRMELVDLMGEVAA